MDWRDIPVGIIKNDQLLNALLALWKTRYALSEDLQADELAILYNRGFEEGLDAIAQFAGLNELFNARKEEQRKIIEQKHRNNAKQIANQVLLIE